MGLREYHEMDDITKMNLMSHYSSSSISLPSLLLEALDLQTKTS